MEKLTGVKVFQVEFVCETCKQGNMVFDGMTLTSNPPWFVHKCDNVNCGITANLRQRYPTIRYEKK